MRSTAPMTQPDAGVCVCGTKPITQVAHPIFIWMFVNSVNSENCLALESNLAGFLRDI